jgi:hypothetical protein
MFGYVSEAGIYSGSKEFSGDTNGGKISVPDLAL